MRITVFDTNQTKFTQGMINHWRASGHEVKWFNTCHMPLIEWADLIWFDCVDANLKCATTKLDIAGKKIIARAIDLDVWAKHFNSVDWNKVDHLIFIAKHIQDFMLGEKRIPDRVGIHLIPCGVDLEKFTMRKKPERNNSIAVVMRLWHGKGIDYLLQLIAALPDYHFHICGDWGLGSVEKRWYIRYIEQFLSHYDNWTRVTRVNDMNEWLEDKTFGLVCSKKETYSYAGWESAAKGLKPVVHEFFGAESVWPDQFRWRTIEEAIQLIRGPYEPSKYREYVAERYPLSRMLDAMDVLLGG